MTLSTERVLHEAVGTIAGSGKQSLELQQSVYDSVSLGSSADDAGFGCQASRQAFGPE